MSPRHSDATPGWIKRRFLKIEKQIRELSAARRMESATIGKGGITIKGGGSITTKYPDNSDALKVGPYPSPGPERDAYGLLFKDELGNDLLSVLRELPNSTYPAGQRVFDMRELDFALVSAASIMWSTPSGRYVAVTPGGVELNGGSDGVMIEHSTTGASTNCFIDPSDNRIWRSTSSRRYKQDIEDATVDPAEVLQLRPRTWRDKGEVERERDGKGKVRRRYIGLIAEEVADHPTLRQFVTRDADGKPEAVDYDRLVVALLAVVKDQEKRITALEAVGQPGS